MVRPLANVSATWLFVHPSIADGHKLRTPDYSVAYHQSKAAEINLSISINFIDDIFISAESLCVYFQLLALFLGKSNAEAKRLSVLLLCVLSSSNCEGISLAKAEASCHAAMSRAFANSWQMKKIMNSIKIWKWLLMFCVCVVFVVVCVVGQIWRLCTENKNKLVIGKK